MVAARLLQRKCRCGGPPGPSGECEACRGKRLHRVATTHPSSVKSDSSAVPAVVREALRSPGQPLDAATRVFMEARFGHDFTHVRVHTDPVAAASARAVDALAYTVGRDIVFGDGQYRMRTAEGRQLIAHELAHVLQQRGTTSADAVRLNGGDAEEEHEAEAASSRAMTGLSVYVRRQSRVLQRYGHAHSCKEDEHLKPFVWPGHHHAKIITQKALEKTDGRPLDPTAAGSLKTFFGSDSADPANVAKIHANFVTIEKALNENYLYHCSKKGDQSDADARVCKGQNAETDPSGRKDITLCFDQVGGWSVPAAGWVIVHENVHRGRNVWGHGWEAGKVDKCLTKSPSQVSLELDNPDAYACFAVLL